MAKGGFSAAVETVYKATKKLLNIKQVLNDGQNTQYSICRWILVKNTINFTLWKGFIISVWARVVFFFSFLNCDRVGKWLGARTTSFEYFFNENKFATAFSSSKMSSCSNSTMHGGQNWKKGEEAAAVQGSRYRRRNRKEARDSIGSGPPSYLQRASC